MRDRIEEFGDAAVVVVTFARQRALAGYRSRFVDPLTVVTDPERAAYRAFGLGRGPWWRVWGPSVWWEYARLMASGRRFERPTGDTLQLGGDFVVARDGTIAYAFRSAGPDDRPPVADLVAAVGSRPDTG